ncbi:MAG: heat-inducible transcription repressor HrcA [Alicyclobacillaceae bacterium]|nr:heat-inducible transcription repressor HrcA [Alicyclobacillaceae bacterium]
MLTSRQKLILSAIVEDYVRSAEPVGSRALSKHNEIHLSAATIRNEMADLEEMGLLDQPHMSAGRIPSQKGYRFYVDNLMMRAEIDAETLAALREVFVQRMTEVERIIQQTSIVLSQLTQYTTIVKGPRLDAGRIKRVELVPLVRGTVVAILVTDTGHVVSRQVLMSEDVTPDDLAQIVNLLNTKLREVPLSRMRSHFYQEVSEEMARTLERYEDALAVLDELCAVDPESGRVYVGGTTNILAQPEFRDVDKVRPLLALLEREETAGQVLPKHQPGLQVRIGRENEVPMLQECTVIAATYAVDGVPVGSVGVLGPTRMNYARVVRILDYVSNALTRVMTERLSGA